MNNSHNILQSVKTTSRLSTGTTHLFHSRKTSLLHSTKKQCWVVLLDVCPRHLVGSFQCFHQFPEAYQSSLINSRHVNSEMLPVTWITQDVIKLENLDVKEEREREWQSISHVEHTLIKAKPCYCYMLLTRNISCKTFNIRQTWHKFHKPIFNQTLHHLYQSPYYTSLTFWLWGSSLSSAPPSSLFS